MLQGMLAGGVTGQSGGKSRMSQVMGIGVT